MFLPSLRASTIGNFKAPVAAAGDVTPNAVNWANVGNTSSASATTSMLQITGIDQTITLTISWTGSGGTFQYSNNSVATFNATGVLTTSPTNITITNNRYLGFRLSNSPRGNQSRSVTVTNASDGNAVLDTFTLTTGNDP